MDREAREWRIVVVRKDGQILRTEARDEDDLQRRLDSAEQSPTVASYHAEYRVVGPWTPDK